MQLPHALEQEQRVIAKLKQARPLAKEQLLDKQSTEQDLKQALRRLLGQGRVIVMDDGRINLVD